MKRQKENYLKSIAYMRTKQNVQAKEVYYQPDWRSHIIEKR